jgi:hypothetical protein
MNSPQHIMPAALAALLAVFATSEASAYCPEPSTPSCVGRYGEFDDQWDFDGCKREMESYKGEVEEFFRCNNNQAGEALRKARSDNDDALSEYNEAIESLNRRARGG